MVFFCATGPLFWGNCRANIILCEDDIENHQETLPDRRWNIGLLRIKISILIAGSKFPIEFLMIPKFPELKSKLGAKNLDLECP